MTPTPGPRARWRDTWHGLSANQRGALWMIAAALGFTVNGALVKTLGALDMPAIEIAFLRALVSLMALLPFLWHVGLGVLRSDHAGVHLIRAVAGGGAMISGFYALTLLPLADVTALSFTTPLFTILLAVPLLGERVRWRRWSATAVGFLGVLIMARPGVGSFEPGAALAVLMAFGIALATTMVKRLPPRESPVAMLLWFCIASILMSGPPTLLVWRQPSGQELLLLIGVGLLGVLAQSLIIRAYKAGEATFVAPFDYSKLILAGLIGFFLFGEVPDAWTLLGAGIIVAATLYIARREAALGEAKPLSESVG